MSTIFSSEPLPPSTKKYVAIVKRWKPKHAGEGLTKRGRYAVGVFSAPAPRDSRAHKNQYGPCGDYVRVIDTYGCELGRYETEAEAHAAIDVAVSAA